MNGMYGLFGRHWTGQARTWTPAPGWWLLALVIATVAAVLLDWATFRAISAASPEARAPIERASWVQALRAVGWVPTWVALGLGVLLLDLRARQGIGRGLGVVLGAGLGGLLAELGKMVIGRERPVRDGYVQFEGEYVWRAPLQGFVGSSNLGLPSSHTAVAFGGAVALGLMFPPVRWLAVLLACGCGLTRVMTGAHFLSDVVVGAFAGALAARLLVRDDPRAARP